MESSIERLGLEIAEILRRRVHSIWLYGSVVLKDYRPGWSDIDFIAFADGPISEAQAAELLTLRQTLSEKYPDDPYYRCFEGVITDLSEYQTGRYTRLVYWGTTGQRITDRYEPDAFARYQLARFGISVRGDGDRSIFSVPDQAELTAAVRRHYETIRSVAVQTNERLYSCGWLLDIARCIYTLRFRDVISKTDAGTWALKEHLFPDDAPLIRTLEIRRDPSAYKDRPEVREWLRGLGPTVQACADVLERELSREL